MPCDFNNIQWCIDLQINAIWKKSSKELTEPLPPCIDGHWASLPEPIPHGSYGTIYTEKIYPEAPKDLRVAVMVGGRIIAFVHWGETRNWTCVPGSLDLVS